MRGRRAAAALGAVALLTTGLSACGGTAAPDETTGGNDLTVYASLPLSGPQRAQSLAVVRGARLALGDRGGRVGKYRVRLVTVDDGTPKSQGADPGQVSQNARQAARDRRTIAYLGELGSTPTAVSLPILNEAGVLQVSPTATAIGLTSDAPGADKGEPEKYYPTSKRTFGRVVPDDTVQARALVATMRQQGCTSLSIFDDRSVYGSGVSRAVQAAIRPGGPRLAVAKTIDPDGTDFTDAADEQRKAASDCILYAGVAGPAAVPVVKAVAGASPQAKLFAAGGVGDGVVAPSFLDPAARGLPPALARRMLVTAAPLDPKAYPASGQEVLRKAGGTTFADRSALYGYAAMAAILDAIQRAGGKGNHPQKVFESFFDKPRHPESVLGSYTIDEDGDTSIVQYGVYTIRNGALVFQRAFDGKS